MAKTKKELDKDLMFSKIMPALTSNPFSTLPASADGIADNSDALTALRDKIFARSNEYIESETVATINVMENLVLNNVDSVMQRLNVCSWGGCRSNICAYALNHLPVRYIVAHKEKIEKAEAEISQKMVIDALIKAVIQVRSHPRH